MSVTDHRLSSTITRTLSSASLKISQQYW